MLKSLIISSIIVNVGLLLGRITGLIREVVIASEYGVGQESDVILFVLSIPDLLLNILVGGGLAVALIPEFSDVISSKRKQALLVQALAFFLLFSAFFVLIISVFDDFVIGFFAPGFDSEMVSASKSMYIIVVWIIPLTVFSGVLTAYLNAGSHFLSSSLGTFCLNIFIISGLLFSGLFDFNIALLGVFVLLGGLSRIFLQVAETSYKGMFDWHNFSMKPWLLSSDIIYRYLQVAFSGSLILCFPLVFRAYATNVGEGYYSIFNYAFKLVELPQVMLLGFISVVLFPKLSSSFTTNRKLYLDIMSWGARISILLSVLALVTCVVFSKMIVSIVFGYGEMEVSDVNRIVDVFDILIISLPFTGMALYLIMIFNAIKKTDVPLIINAITLIGMLTSLSTVEVSFVNYATIYVLTYVVSCTLSLSFLFFIDRESFFALLEIKWLVYISICLFTYFYILEIISNLSSGYLFTIMLSSISFILVVFLFALIVPEVRKKIIHKFL